MTADLTRVVSSLLAGFVFGSIPFGLLISKSRGIDIRQHGSGNIGFTNALRTLPWPWALAVLLLDIAKGALPVALAPRFGLLTALVGSGAVLGHVLTPWLGFRGGKGVATAIGVAAILTPRSLLPAMALYLGLLLLAGIVSLASLSLAVSLPLLTTVIYPRDWQLLGFTLTTGIIILLRHRSNITRLAARTEPRLNIWLRLFRRQ